MRNVATPPSLPRADSQDRFVDGAAFIDGNYVPIHQATLPILDWGLLRSDATYDVVHVWRGKFFRLRRHLQRFEQSVRQLRMSLSFSRDEIADILTDLVRLTGLRDAYVEVLCTRGMPPTGTRDPRRCVNRFAAFVVPFVWIVDESVRERGIDLHVSNILRIPPESVDPRVKNYHWGDMTRAMFDAYDAGCDLPVLLDLRGNVAEGPGFNVFCLQLGMVKTPHGTCLEGITRQTALELLGDMNVRAEFGDVTPDELRHADEVFVTSTAGGIIPVVKIDHHLIADGEIGPISKRLIDLYWQRHDQGLETTPIDYR